MAKLLQIIIWSWIQAIFTEKCTLPCEVKSKYLVCPQICIKAIEGHMKYHLKMQLKVI